MKWPYVLQGVPHVRRALAPTMGLFLAVCLAHPAHSQGCSQCREAVGQTPARTQTAYRRGILIMVSAGATVFAAGLITLRRFR